MSDLMLIVMFVGWFCLLGFLAGWVWAELRHIDKESDGFDAGWESAIVWMNDIKQHTTEGGEDGDHSA